jgi:hypothetical protein
MPCGSNDTISLKNSAEKRSFLRAFNAWHWGTRIGLRVLVISQVNFFVIQELDQIKRGKHAYEFIIFHYG